MVLMCIKKAGPSLPLPRSLTIEFRFFFLRTTILLLLTCQIQLPSPVQRGRGNYLLLKKEVPYTSHWCITTKRLLPNFILGTKPYGLKNSTNAATNAAAIAMISTQTQIEALASFLSSISVTSFVPTQMPIE